jgi:hypothetical protein
MYVRVTVGGHGIGAFQMVTAYHGTGPVVPGPEPVSYNQLKKNCITCSGYKENEQAKDVDSQLKPFVQLLQKRI